MGRPWNGWYHCIGHTYGSWLYGDPRGFRTRHHREHVDGDYRHPPAAGAYERRLRRSIASMRFEPVALSQADRLLVCRVIARTLIDQGTELIDLSVGAHHVHLIARFPRQLACEATPTDPANILRDGRNPIPRHLLGRAKRAASMALAGTGRKAQGHPLWARRTKIVPIQDRAHQVTVVHYIRDHALEGAIVWSCLV